MGYMVKTADSKIAFRRKAEALDYFIYFFTSDQNTALIDRKLMAYKT